jgi:hypothetical protein
MAAGGGSDQNIVLELKAKYEQFVSSFENDIPDAVKGGMGNVVGIVEGAMEDVKDKIVGTCDAIVESFTAAGAAAAATFIEKIKEGIDEAAEYAERLKVEHLETGDTYKNLQALTLAFASVGASSDRTAVQFALFQRRIEEAASLSNGRSPFERMGLDPKKMETGTLIANLEAFADKLTALGSTTEKVSVINQTFGRGSAALLPIFEEGRAGIESLVAAYQGAVMPNDVIASLQHYGETLGVFKVEWESFSAEFGQPLINALRALHSSIGTMLNDFQNLSPVDKATLQLGAFAAALATGATAVDVVSATIPALGVIIAPIAGAFNLLALAIAGFAIAWRYNAEAALSVADRFADNVARLFGNIRTAMSGVAEEFVGELGPALLALGRALADLVGEIAGNTDGWALLRKAVDLVITVITVLIKATAAVTEALSHLGELLQALGNIITQYIYPWTRVAAAIGNATDALEKFKKASTGSNDIEAGKQGVQLLGDAWNFVANRLGLTKEAQEQEAKLEASLAHDAVYGKGKHGKQNYGVSDDDMGDFLASGGQGGAENGAAHGWLSDTWKKIQQAMKLPQDPKGGTAKLSELPKKGSDTTSLQVDALNAPMERYKDAIKKAKDALDELHNAMEKTKNEDPTKAFIDSQRIYNEQIKATIVLQHAHLAAEQEAKRLANEFTAKAKTAKSPDDAQKFKEAAKSKRDEEASYHTEVITDRGKEIALQNELNRLVEEHYKKIADDETKTFAERLAAAQKLVSIAATHREGLLAELKINQEILVVQKARADLSYSGDKQTIEQRKAVRDTQVIRPDDEQAQHLKALADAQDTLAEKTVELKEAQVNYSDAQKELDALSRAGVIDQKQLEAAQQALITSSQQYLAAQNAVTVADQQLINVNQQTSTSVDVVRKDLDQLGSEGSSLITKFVQLSQQGVDPLTAAFLTLFSKSASMVDITTILTNITTQLAQVFDALRPVIDLLLGVLVGIVDVFLEMYNILTEIISAFGIHLQKIQLVNASLNNMADAIVPVVQIVHDIPTINQYNAGQVGNLQAEESPINNFQQVVQNGFNQSIAKFGEIIGILIAVRVLLAVISGNSVASLFGGGGGVGGVLNSIGKLFGIGGGGAATGSSDQVINPDLGPGLTPQFPVTSVPDVGPPVLDDTLGTSVNPMVIETDAANPIMVTPVIGGPSLGGVDTTVAASSVASPTGASEMGTLSDTTKASTSATIGLGQAVTGLGDIFSIYSGAKTGGISGGIQAGLGIDSLLATVVGLSGGIATPVAIGVGLLAALFGGGGNKANPTTNPDEFESQTNFGQDIADLQGKAGASGVNYSEDPSVSNALSGQTMLQYINSNLSLLPQSLAQEFAGMTGIDNLHNGNMQLHGDSGQVGPMENWNTLFQSAQTAVTDIMNQIQSGAESAGNLLTGATTVASNLNTLNLAALYGNGSAMTALGTGEITTGNTTVGTGGASETLAATPTLNVQIGTIVGTDAATMTANIKSAFANVQAQWAQTAVAQRRSQSYMAGYASTGAST